MLKVNLCHLYVTVTLKINSFVVCLVDADCHWSWSMGGSLVSDIVGVCWYFICWYLLSLFYCLMLVVVLRHASVE